MSYRLRDMRVITRHTLAELENYKSHWRLRVFWIFGTKCVSCPREGTQLVKLQHKTIEEFRPVDVFTSRMVLMTVDHIVPKSMGGGNTLDNMQPMCVHCNNVKSNHNMTNEELAIIVKEKVRWMDIGGRLSELRRLSYLSG